MSSISTSAIRESHLVFWSRQLSEHALFLHLGLEIEPYKSLGLRIHQEWEVFRRSFPDDIEFKGDRETIARFNELANELKDYKLEVLTQLTACVRNTDQNPSAWLGWISPTFAEHIIRELNYAWDKINGQRVSVEEEVNFWRLVNKEHALFATQLLDLSESNLIRIAYILANKIANDDACESRLFVKISLQNIKELDEYNREAKSLLNKNQVRSTIHPVLLTHVIREGQRSIGILDDMRDASVRKIDDIFDDYSQLECNKDGKTPRSISVACRKH